jgi:long-chain acyl-CoA synthetase
VTPDGGDVGVGEAGELLLRGEMLMTGYVADPEGTAAALEGGWLRTGDLATRGEDGFYRVVGRRKNLVISGGRNMQPEEVTEALHDLPGVSEAVAFGVEDEVAGEVVAACVALEDGCSLTVEELAEMCRERLSPYKVPRVIARVPALPRGASGKVVVEQARRLLKQVRADRANGGGGDLGERVRSIAARVFNLPEGRLTPGSRSNSTPGWDSFGHLSLVLALEESFAIRLGTADILALHSLADAERIVGNLLQSAADPCTRPE